MIGPLKLEQSDTVIQVKIVLVPRDATAAIQSVHHGINHRTALALPSHLLDCRLSSGPYRPHVSQLDMFPAKCHSVSLSSSFGSISRFAFMKTVS